MFVKHAVEWAFFVCMYAYCYFSLCICEWVSECLLGKERVANSVRLANNKILCVFGTARAKTRFVGVHFRLFFFQIYDSIYIRTQMKCSFSPNVATAIAWLSPFLPLLYDLFWTFGQCQVNIFSKQISYRMLVRIYVTRFEYTIVQTVRPHQKRTKERKREWRGGGQT